MTAAEFKAAVALAKNPSVDLIAETRDCADIFDGFALTDFQPVTVSLQQVAGLIAYQALQFNGEWDNIALNEIRTSGRKKFIIV